MALYFNKRARRASLRALATHALPAMPWIVCIAMLIIWELACTYFSVPDFVLPKPSRIASVLVTTYDPIWFHAKHTLATTLAGFALAVISGLSLGIAVGSSRYVFASLYPLLVGFNSVPKVALVPVLVVWFGIGTTPAILTAALMSFFPIAVNVATGLATVEPELEDVLRSLGAKKRDLIFKVGLPRSLPYFFASLKIAITLAFVGSVISESIASSQGIGTLMVRAASDFRIPLVFAGLVVTAAMGIVMHFAFSTLETYTTGWATRRNVDP
jgi:NitT/TauT family transport system permease protein